MAPDRQGVSSVLKLLGIPVDLTAKLVGPELEKKGWPTWIWPCITRPSAGFWKCGRIRVRNFFHPVARMLNPTRAGSQVIGLSHPPYFEKDG